MSKMIWRPYQDQRGSQADLNGLTLCRRVFLVTQTRRGADRRSARVAARRSCVENSMVLC